MTDVQNKYFLISVQLAKEGIKVSPAAVERVEEVLRSYSRRVGGKMLYELWTGHAAELPQLKRAKVDSRDKVSIVLKEKYSAQEEMTKELGQ